MKNLFFQVIYCFQSCYNKWSVIILTWKEKKMSETLKQTDFADVYLETVTLLQFLLRLPYWRNDLILYQRVDEDNKVLRHFRPQSESFTEERPVIVGVPGSSRTGASRSVTILPGSLPRPLATSWTWSGLFSPISTLSKDLYRGWRVTNPHHTILLALNSLMSFWFSRAASG